jgi:hypothetical protein
MDSIRSVKISCINNTSILSVEKVDKNDLDYYLLANSSKHHARLFHFNRNVKWNRPLLSLCIMISRYVIDPIGSPVSIELHPSLG